MRKLIVFNHVTLDGYFTGVNGDMAWAHAPAGLIDECQVMVNPIVLGKGRLLFAGIQDTLNLKLTKTRAFGNGKVFLCYQPVA